MPREFVYIDFGGSRLQWPRRVSALHSLARLRIDLALLSIIIHCITTNAPMATPRDNLHSEWNRILDYVYVSQR